MLLRALVRRARPKTAEPSRMTFEISGSKTTILLMAFGTRDLRHWVLGPSGIGTNS